MKTIKMVIAVAFMVISHSSFAQEFSNDSNNTIMVMDGESQGLLDIFVDPTSFNCECDGVIQLTVKETKTKNVFTDNNNAVTLTIKGGSYIIQVHSKVDCCFVKPGTYTR
jgi:hypothetical protein